MEKIKAFIEKAKTDSELAAKLEELAKQNADVGEVIALAAEHGFTLTQEDLGAAKCGGCQKPCELSEDELDKVAGGQGGIWTINHYNADICKNLTRIRPGYCDGFSGLAFACDHFYLLHCDFDFKQKKIFRFTCAMNGFPPYKAYLNGEPY